jgi:hypothetical protein
VTRFRSPPPANLASSAREPGGRGPKLKHRASTEVREGCLDPLWNEELYQKVSFQEGSNGVWSPYTGWYYSGVTSMSN